MAEAKIDKNGSIVSPWRVPLKSRIYSVVAPPLKTQDSRYLSKIFTHKIKVLPKPYFSETDIKNTMI